MAAWERLRYARLLPLAAAYRRFANGYAALVGVVEARRDPLRRSFAEHRMQRWLGIAPAAARRLHRECLRSEAYEEADAAFFMGRPATDLAAAFAVTNEEGARAGEAVLYVGLHLGSPVLGYLGLTSMVPDLALIARGLDPGNPLSDAKRRFAAAKVAWTEARAGRPFFGTDGESMLKVRSHLRGGKPLYLLADVPGDTVGRAEPCRMFGEAVRVAAGLPTLARIATSPVQTLAVTREARGFRLRFGPRLAPGPITMPAVLDALAPFIRAHADQWWMWPYLPTAD